MTTPAQQDAARRAIFARRLGHEIRQYREAGGLSQDGLAELFGWSRSAISKIELGHRDIGLFDYLTVMQFLRDLDPDHPAVALAARLLPTADRSWG